MKIKFNFEAQFDDVSAAALLGTTIIHVDKIYINQILIAYLLHLIHLFVNDFFEFLFVVGLERL